MFRKPFLLLLAGLLTCWIPLCAQNEAPPEDPAAEKPKAGDSPGPNRFWQARLSGGHFMVALDRIVSVSRHKYLLDGALIVDEVTIDTVGQGLARFYFISPITDAVAGNAVTGLANRGRELVETAAGRAGTSAQNMVVKKYPDTTHAKSIEYRVLSEAELTSLHSSVRTAWENGKGRQFTAK